MNETQILKKLNAQDFRSIKKEDIIQFASNLSDLPAEVQEKLLEQFPAFANLSEAVSNRYCELVDGYLHDTDLIRLQLSAHQKVIDTFQKRIDLLGDDMSHSDFMNIMLDMQNEADKIERAVERQQERHERVVNAAGAVVGFAIAIPAAAVGLVKFLKK